MKAGSASLARVPKTRSERSDAELMRALANGELGPLGDLYDRYHEDVRQFVRRACSRDEDVDDIVHDAFLTASRAAGSYDGRPCARPFLVGVAAQVVRQRRRRWARFRSVLEAFFSTPDPAPPRTPEDHAESAETAARLERALARLTDEKRLVLLLFEREGLSGEEVARALEIPLGTVWTRLYHARADMRRALGGRQS
jgi:RNA polymerase sigma-70 factor (ECF subfamily)